LLLAFVLPARPLSKLGCGRTCFLPGRRVLTAPAVFSEKKVFFWLIPEHLFLDKINYTHHTRKPGDICRVTASQPAQEDRK
jgi:hypothetical protein